MGKLGIILNRTVKTKNEFYMFPKNISNINQVSTITYGKKEEKEGIIFNRPDVIRLYIEAPKDVVILRREVVDREYGGIENLVRGIKSGEVEYLELEGKVKCQRK